MGGKAGEVNPLISYPPGSFPTLGREGAVPPWDAGRGLEIEKGKVQEGGLSINRQHPWVSV